MIGGVTTPVNNGTVPRLSCEPDPTAVPLSMASVACYNHSLKLWVEQTPLPYAMTNVAAVYWKGAVYTFGGRVSMCVGGDAGASACGATLEPGTTD